MKRMLTAFVAAGCIAGAISQASFAGAATDVANTDDNVTRVVTAGSDTTYFVLNKLAAAYNESLGCALNNVAIERLNTTLVPTTLPTAPLTHNQCVGATNPETNASAAQASVLKTENYDHDTVINFFPQGSSAGLRQLCAQLNVTDPLRSRGLAYIDVARSSSAPGVAFQCRGTNNAPFSVIGTRILRFVAFAKDALTWTKWNNAGGGGAPVSNLTVAQLNDILVDCTITTWDQVGGANTNPIIVYTAITASGSRASWDAFVGGNTSTCIPGIYKDGNQANGERVIREHQQQPVEVALNDPDPFAANEGNALFFSSVGIWTVDAVARQNSVLGNVDGLAPNETNIVAGTFPFARSLYNVYINSGPSPVASEATRRFTAMRSGGTADTRGWICKPENSHSKPLDDVVNAGVPAAAADQAYGKLVDTTLRSAGFYPLTNDPTLDRCTFADYRIDETAQTPI